MTTPIASRCLSLLATFLIMAGGAMAAEPVCNDGSGCTMFASWSPLTDDTQWIMECDDGFTHSGIIRGNVECILCPC